jgi:hypothetical protein
MSRHSLSESKDGQIKLNCQHGHELGAIMVQPRAAPLLGRSRRFSGSRP